VEVPVPHLVETMLYGYMDGIPQTGVDTGILLGQEEFCRIQRDHPLGNITTTELYVSNADVNRILRESALAKKFRNFL